MDRVASGNMQGVLDPALEIVDSHHHLWKRPESQYLFREFSADVNTGHNVRATVFVECGAMYRSSGPVAMRAVGEVEFVAGVAAMSESGLFGGSRVASAIIGSASLSLGSEVAAVIEAMECSGGGRFRGVRGAAAWDEDAAVNLGLRPFAPRGLLLSPRFREGVAELASRDLIYEAWQYFPQLTELCSLADKFPNMPIVVDHCGGWLGVNRYANSETFGVWKARVAEVANRPNTFMKLGGLSAPNCGFQFERRATAATALELAAMWSPYLETCIELFTPSRCMFESNFPVDQMACSYSRLWDAFKLFSTQYSEFERAQLFSNTATRVYQPLIERAN